ncbi:MAG: hypothetical protein IPL53_20605 [Ignavibacteria bacterium]|nr:hypothetical protein [Ignavibacteria bacterium]
MNIIHNTFNNGSASIVLANYISSISSYYIAYNTFNNAANVNLIGMKINGRIVKNNFTSSGVPIAVHLVNSYPECIRIILQRGM